MLDLYLTEFSLAHFVIQKLSQFYHSWFIHENHLYLSTLQVPDCLVFPYLLSFPLANWPILSEFLAKCTYQIQSTTIETHDAVSQILGQEQCAY